jgi:hypothetical protein
MDLQNIDFISNNICTLALKASTRHIEYDYNHHLCRESLGVAALSSAVLEGHEEEQLCQVCFGVMTVDDHFNSPEIVGEEKFVLSFGICQRLKTIEDRELFGVNRPPR